MNRRVAAWVGSASPLLAVGFLVIAALLDTRSATAIGLPPAPFFERVWALSWLGFPVVGAIILSRRPRHPVGWILVGIGVGVSLSLLVDAYARYTLITHPGALPFGRAAGWLAAWTIVPALGLIPYLILLFPAGHIRSRRWKAVARAGGGAIAALVLWQMVAPVEVSGGSPNMPRFKNPFGLRPLEGVADAVTPSLALAIIVFGLAAVAHLLCRLRHAHPEERKQLKWFAYAAGIIPVLFFLLGLVESSLPATLGDVLTIVVFVVSFNGLAAAIAVAIFKYRLYDIDVLINRTLVYGLLSALLGLVYVGGVFLLQQLLSPMTRESDLAIAGATLAVAAIFRPARARVQAFIDRRFYRRKYDATKILETFATTLREEIDLDALAQELVAVVQRSMQPAHVSLWLTSPNTAAGATTTFRTAV